MMKTPFQEIKEVERKPLRIGAIDMPKEVITIEERLNKFGIKNKTKEFIEEKNNENTKLKRLVGIDAVISRVESILFAYKVIEYKTFDSICKKHNLFISSLQNYNEVIPEENLHELEAFLEVIKYNNEELSKTLNFKTNGSFIFAVDKYGKKLHSLDTSEMFVIAAPKSHFKKKKYLTIGQEMSDSYDRPKFTFDIKIQKREPIDPIIALPFEFANKVYVMVVTAWDEVADDSRLRMMF